MKVRIKFRKNGVMKFIGHLDIMRYFQKAMRRAQIPIAFTGGYSPHMIMSFAQPLGVGITSDGEYMDIELTEAVDSEEAVLRLNDVMAEGMKIVSFREIPADKKSQGMTIVAAADYLVTPIGGTFPAGWQKALAAFGTLEKIVIRKQTKRSEQDVDIRPLIYDMHLEGDRIFLQLASGSAANLKPQTVMEAFALQLGLNADALRYQTHRLEIYADTENGLTALEDLGQPVILNK